jgi:hypothetical protein
LPLFPDDKHRNLDSDSNRLKPLGSLSGSSTNLARKWRSNKSQNLAGFEPWNQCGFWITPTLNLRHFIRTGPPDKMGQRKATCFLTVYVVKSWHQLCDYSTSKPPSLHTQSPRKLFCSQSVVIRTSFQAILAPMRKTVQQLEMEKRGNIRRLNRVVLVPAPFQGHINPMLQLGTILHSKGFSITVVHTQYNSPKPSSHTNFSFLPLPDTSSSATTIDEIIHFALQLNTDCKTHFQECLAEVMRQLGPYDGIACIIYDQLMYFSEAAAKDLKLPCIVLRTGSAAVSLARDALFQLKAEGLIPFPGIFNMKKDTIIFIL